jgi:glutamate synthase (NADPH/NADH) small chain
MGKENRVQERKAAAGRVAMPAQEPHERIHNFNEVALGYTQDQAFSEAGRCRQCKKKPCREGCPVGVDIPGFIGLLREGDIPGAARKIKEANNLPAICGRVCPQEEQCEKFCILGKKGEPVAIGRLERFAADYERVIGGELPTPPAPLPGCSVRGRRA